MMKVKLRVGSPSSHNFAQGKSKNGNESVIHQKSHCIERNDDKDSDDLQGIGGFIEPTYSFLDFKINFFVFTPFNLADDSQAHQFFLSLLGMQRSSFLSNT